MTEEIFGDELGRQARSRARVAGGGVARARGLPGDRATSTPSAAVASPASSWGGPGLPEEGLALTVEDVRDHFDEIESTDDFMLLRNAMDELRVVSKLLG